MYISRSKLTIPILQHEPRLQARPLHQRHQFIRPIMQMDAIQPTRIQIPNRHRHPRVHQHGEILHKRKVSLPAYPVGSIGYRPVGRQVELEVVVGVAVAGEVADALRGCVGALERRQLRGGVGGVGTRPGGYGGWVGEGAVFGVEGGAVLAGLDGGGGGEG